MVHCVHFFVMSRALYNAHLWVVDSRVLPIANTVYYRALRRVAGESWTMGFKKKPAIVIRKALGEPSIDCILFPKMTGRLWTIGEVATHVAVEVTAAQTRQCQEDLGTAV